MKTLRHLCLLLLAFVLLAKTSAIAQSLGSTKSAGSIRSPRAVADLDLRKILKDSDDSLQACPRGAGAANFALGHESFLGTGKGKLKDFRRAAHYFAQAANEGSSAGQFCLALMLYKGEGEGIDVARAKALLERAKRGPLNDRFVRLAWYLDDLTAAAAVN